jgi:hypothetical protein
MPLGKPIKGLSGNELLCDLPFERDAVGTLSGHSFHPLKAQLPLSIHLPQPVRPQGRTPLLGEERTSTRDNRCLLSTQSGHKRHNLLWRTAKFPSANDGYR